MLPWHSRARTVVRPTTLEVRVAGDTISYVVNGTVVHTTPKGGATAVTDGIVGVRVNHLLDVMIRDFEVVR